MCNHSYMYIMPVNCNQLENKLFYSILFYKLLDNVDRIQAQKLSARLVSKGLSLPEGWLQATFGQQSEIDTQVLGKS